MASTYHQEMQKYFKTHSKVRDYGVHSSKVHSVGWNCDGRRLASGSFDKTACTFTLERDRLVKDHSLRGHGDSVDQLCWHPSHPDLFVTASGDKTIRIWDARTSKSTATITTKGENINICWSPDGKTIAVGNKEDLVMFFDVKSHKSKMEQQFKFEVNEISWDNSGELFFVTSGSGTVQVNSYPTMKVETTLHCHAATCICVEFGQHGRYFATGGADALVTIWDLTELVCLRTMSRLDWPIRTLSFRRDDRMLACASEDLIIDICEVETGEKITEIPVESPTFTCAWNPKHDLLAYACDDKDKYNRDRDAGTVKLFGLPNDSS